MLDTPQHTAYKPGHSTETALLSINEKLGPYFPGMGQTLRYGVT